MKLQDQLTNLQLSKKLKELGVKQESIWWWEVCISGKRLLAKKYLSYTDKDLTYYHYSAFTVAELGEGLPNFITIEHYLCALVIHRTMGGEWFLRYEGSKKESELFSANTEANARCRMLIYLIENGLLNKKI